MSLNQKTAHELRDMLSRREVSSVEITQSVIDAINEREGRINAFMTLTPEQALATAAEADKALAAGDASVTPLTGIPVAIKDNICTNGVPTTCSSKMLENFIPPYDATIITKLKVAHVPSLGKLNMDEFAMGASTESSAFKKTSNPWDLDYVPGGSSGGCAAAVSSDMTISAIGSDTGGSIRQPASFCGVVGLKPTYGLVSRYGLMAFASSLDQIGPLAKDVEDAALLLNELAGYDPEDSTSAPFDHPDYTSFLNKDVKGQRVGLPKEYFAEGLDADVRAAVEQAIKDLETAGASVVEVELPTLPYAVGAYYLCATAEASSNLARYVGVYYGSRTKGDNVIDMYNKTRAENFGAEVKRRIMLGTYALSAGFYDAYYLKALRVRTLISNDFKRAFEKCDVIAGPTSPSAAFPIGEKVSDPLSMYLNDIFTSSVNLAGISGISIPCGFTKGGLPIGLQLIAPAFEEGRLFRVGHAYEQATEWHKRRPEMK